MAGRVFEIVRYHLLNLPVSFLAQVVWENMKCLPNGEAVSVDGTHLGHNLPDWKGNR
jgi:hypothetical protein